MKQRIIDAAEACRRMARLREEAISVTQAASEQGLTDLSFAVYELLEQSIARESGRSRESPAISDQRVGYAAAFDDRLKGIAIGIEQVMNKGQAIVDWQSKEDVQRVMRRDIKRELRKLDGLMEEEIEELARSMVEIARRKGARG